MFKKTTTIGLLILALLLNGIVMNRGVSAVTYDSANPYLKVNINSYAQIDNDCSGAMSLTVNNDNVTNIKAAIDRFYGFDQCRIDFGYNDDTQEYAITFGKTQNYSGISKSGGKTFQDINNAVSTTIHTDDFTTWDEEKFCYNVTGDILETGDVRIDPDTSYRFNDITAPQGQKRCFNIQDITTDPDEIAGSDAAGVCPYGLCYFTLNLHARMSAYTTDQGYTVWGTFDKFNNSPFTADYTVRLTLTTATP
jgi:hypothetical protein